MGKPDSGGTRAILKNVFRLRHNGVVGRFSSVDCLWRLATPALPVPATVTVPAGGNYSNLELTFSAGASGNTVGMDVTPAFLLAELMVITATYGGSTTTAMVTIN